MSLQPIKCKLCNKIIPEGVPIIGEKPEEVRGRKWHHMQVHMQQSHRPHFQIILELTKICSLSIPAILIGADFEIPEDMEQQRQAERSKLAKILRRTTLTDDEIAAQLPREDHYSIPQFQPPHGTAMMPIADAFVLMLNLRDRYEEIGAYALTAPASPASESQQAPETQGQSTPAAEANPQESTPPPR